MSIFYTREELLKVFIIVGDLIQLGSYIQIYLHLKIFLRAMDNIHFDCNVHMVFILTIKFAL